MASRPSDPHPLEFALYASTRGLAREPTYLGTHPGPAQGSNCPDPFVTHRTLPLHRTGKQPVEMFVIDLGPTCDITDFGDVSGVEVQWGSTMALPQMVHLQGAASTEGPFYPLDWESHFVLSSGTVLHIPPSHTPPRVIRILMHGAQPFNGGGPFPRTFVSILGGTTPSICHTPAPVTSVEVDAIQATLTQLALEGGGGGGGGGVEEGAISRALTKCSTMILHHRSSTLLHALLATLPTLPPSIISSPVVASKLQALRLAITHLRQLDITQKSFLAWAGTFSATPSQALGWKSVVRGEAGVGRRSCLSIHPLYPSYVKTLAVGQAHDPLCQHTAVAPHCPIRVTGGTEKPYWVFALDPQYSLEGVSLGFSLAPSVERQTTPAFAMVRLWREGRVTGCEGVLRLKEGAAMASTVGAGGLVAFCVEEKYDGDPSLAPMILNKPAFTHALTGPHTVVCMYVLPKSLVGERDGGGGGGGKESVSPSASGWKSVGPLFLLPPTTLLSCVQDGMGEHTTFMGTPGESTPALYPLASLQGGTQSRGVELVCVGGVFPAYPSPQALTATPAAKGEEYPPTPPVMGRNPRVMAWVAALEKKLLLTTPPLPTNALETSLIPLKSGGFKWARGRTGGEGGEDNILHVPLSLLALTTPRWEGGSKAGAFSHSSTPDWSLARALGGLGGLFISDPECSLSIATPQPHPFLELPTRLSPESGFLLARCGGGGGAGFYNPPQPSVDTFVKLLGAVGECVDEVCRKRVVAAGTSDGGAGGSSSSSSSPDSAAGDAPPTFTTVGTLPGSPRITWQHSKAVVSDPLMGFSLRATPALPQQAWKHFKFPHPSFNLSPSPRLLTLLVEEAVAVLDASPTLHCTTRLSPTAWVPITIGGYFTTLSFQLSALGSKGDPMCEFSVVGLVKGGGPGGFSLLFHKDLADVCNGSGGGDKLAPSHHTVALPPRCMKIFLVLSSRVVIARTTTAAAPGATPSQPFQGGNHPTLDLTYALSELSTPTYATPSPLKGEPSHPLPSSHAGCLPRALIAPAALSNPALRVPTCAVLSPTLSNPTLLNPSLFDPAHPQAMDHEALRGRFMAGGDEALKVGEEAWAAAGAADSSGTEGLLSALREAVNAPPVFDDPTVGERAGQEEERALETLTHQFFTAPLPHPPGWFTKRGCNIFASTDTGNLISPGRPSSMRLQSIDTEGSKRQFAFSGVREVESGGGGGEVGVGEGSLPPPPSNFPLLLIAPSLLGENEDENARVLTATAAVTPPRLFVGVLPTHPPVLVDVVSTIRGGDKVRHQLSASSLSTLSALGYLHAPTPPTLPAPTPSPPPPPEAPDALPSQTPSSGGSGEAAPLNSATPVLIPLAAPSSATPSPTPAPSLPTPPPSPLALTEGQRVYLEESAFMCALSPIPLSTLGQVRMGGETLERVFMGLSSTVSPAWGTDLLGAMLSRLPQAEASLKNGGMEFKEDPLHFSLVWLKEREKAALARKGGVGGLCTSPLTFSNLLWAVSSASTSALPVPQAEEVEGLLNRVKFFSAIAGGKSEGECVAYTLELFGVRLRVPLIHGAPSTLPLADDALSSPFSCMLRAFKETGGVLQRQYPLHSYYDGRLGPGFFPTPRYFDAPFSPEATPLALTTLLSDASLVKALKSGGADLPTPFKLLHLAITATNAPTLALLFPSSELLQRASPYLPPTPDFLSLVSKDIQGGAFGSHLMSYLPMLVNAWDSGQYAAHLEWALVRRGGEKRSGREGVPLHRVTYGLVREALHQLIPNPAAAAGATAAGATAVPPSLWWETWGQTLLYPCCSSGLQKRCLLDTLVLDTLSRFALCYGEGALGVEWMCAALASGGGERVASERAIALGRVTALLSYLAWPIQCHLSALSSSDTASVAFYACHASSYFSKCVTTLAQYHAVCPLSSALVTALTPLHTALLRVQPPVPAGNATTNASSGGGATSCTDGSSSNSSSSSSSTTSTTTTTISPTPLCFQPPYVSTGWGTGAVPATAPPLRDDFSGQVGFVFTVASPCLVTALCRGLQSGHNGGRLSRPHPLCLWRRGSRGASDPAHTLLALLSVDASSPVDAKKGFAMAPLPTPLTLHPGCEYALTSWEKGGCGDPWVDVTGVRDTKWDGQNTTNPMSISIQGAVWEEDVSWASDKLEVEGGGWGGAFAPHSGDISPSHFIAATTALLSSPSSTTPATVAGAVVDAPATPTLTVTSLALPCFSGEDELFSRGLDTSGTSLRFPQRFFPREAHTCCTAWNVALLMVQSPSTPTFPHLASSPSFFSGGGGGGGGDGGGAPKPPLPPLPFTYIGEAGSNLFYTSPSANPSLVQFSMEELRWREHEATVLPRTGLAFEGGEREEGADASSPTPSPQDTLQSQLSGLLKLTAATLVTCLPSLLSGLHWSEEEESALPWVNQGLGGFEEGWESSPLRVACLRASLELEGVEGKGGLVPPPLHPHPAPHPLPPQMLPLQPPFLSWWHWQGGLAPSPVLLLALPKSPPFPCLPPGQG